jgi:preprotein translocase subunit YajC
LSVIEILAQTTQPTTTASRQPPEWYQFLASPLFMIVLALAVFYFFAIGGRRKEERKRREMLNQLNKGDRIQTIGGILGTVVEARENDVLVKVDESSNTKIRFSRSAIHRVIESERAESK